MTPFRRTMRPAFFALLGAALACGSPTEPSVPTLDFEGLVVFGIPTLPTTAKLEQGGILVTGVFQTPTSGYTLSGALSVPGLRALRIDVDAHGTSPGLPFATQNYYRAQVRDLAPGVYELSVYHTDHKTAGTPSARVYYQVIRIR